MLFSILLATVDREKEVTNFLRSLASQTCRDFEVIVIDQNPDDRLTPLLDEYRSLFPIRQVRSARGHSRAFNAGLMHAAGELVAFPDDDCWYDPDLLERVGALFAAHPNWSGVTGREIVGPGFTSGGRWDPRPGMVTPDNIWRRAISFTIFLRRNAAAGCQFDETLGVGAGTPWGSGEETDYLLRLLQEGHPIFYDPSIAVWHQGHSGPYTPDTYAKARRYGMGMGRVLRQHGYALPQVARHLARPAGGALLSLLRGDWGKARYHWSICSGRAGGWLPGWGQPFKAADGLHLTRNVARAVQPAVQPAASPFVATYRATAEVSRRLSTQQAGQPAPHRCGSGPAEAPRGLKPTLHGRLATRLARNPLCQNAAALYGVQCVRKLFPLLIIPFLARTLGPAGWGTVAFAQALAEFVVLTIEFGFNLSATREIAQKRESKHACGEIMAGVLGSQMLLAAVGIAGAILVSRAAPLLRDNPKLLAAGLFYAVAQGFMPLWFFQGLERMRLAAALEITGRMVGLISIFVFVRSPQDTWLALFLQGLTPGITTIAGLLMAYVQIPCRIPTWPLVRETLRRGWPMFVFRSAESLYGVGNAFLLGLFAGPVQVGYFASAEKISRAVFGLLNPIRESLYPRLSSMAHHSPAEAARLARVGMMVMIGGGVLLGGGVFLFAPLLIGLLMGRAFSPAVTVLRILSILPVLLSITQSAGLQWLLPFGKDSEVNRIILRAGALNVVLAVILAPYFAHVGMAVAVVCAELFVSLSMVRAAMRSTPLRDRQPVKDRALVPEACEQVMP